MRAAALLVIAVIAQCARALRLVRAPRMCEPAARPAASVFSRRNVLSGAAIAATGTAGLIALKPTTPVFVPAAGSMSERTVVITGANTGLGFESARRLAAASARVVVTARTEEKARSAVSRLREELGESGASAGLVPLALDLADLRSVAAFPAALQNALGSDVAVDVLLNNAGVMVS